MGINRIGNVNTNNTNINPIYNTGISSADCATASGIWAGDDANVMWDYLKGGLQSVIGFLIALTIFYWITGRGHILSS